MSLSSRLSSGFDNIVRKGGMPIRIRYYDQTTGSVYDDDTTLAPLFQGTTSGGSFGWTSGSITNSANSITFPGSPVIAYVPHDSRFDTGSGDFSVSVWINTTNSASSDEWLVNKWDGLPDPYPFVLVQQGATNKMVAGVFDGANLPAVVSPGSMNDGLWHHYVFIRNTGSDHVYLFENGSLVVSGTDTTTPSTSLNNTAPFRLAASNGAFFWGGGSMDDLRFYNRALSSSEILNLFQDNPNLDTGRIYRFSFNEGTGSTFADEPIYTSGIPLPLNESTGNEESTLLEQGKLLPQDQKLYIDGMFSTTGSEYQVKIGLGSPPTEEYTTIPEGGIAVEAEDEVIYKKLYIRRLTNGSLIGE